MVGLATRQRETYFKQAERLAKQFPDLSELEARMKAESKVLVKGLRDQDMRWDEYSRALIDKTLTAALAGVYLGAAGNQPKAKMEQSWPGIVGGMLPPLQVFMDETKDYLDDGTLKPGDDSVDFDEAEEWEDDPELMWGDPGRDIETALDGNPELDPALQAPYPNKTAKQQAKAETKKRKAQGSTWVSLVARVIRYLATPIYSFEQLGRFLRKKEQGYKEMRRIALMDKNTCVDCANYDSAGWQPIGELPMPGRGCRCWDRCRCAVEYR